MYVRYAFAGIDRILLSVGSLIQVWGSLRLHARGCMTEHVGFCKPVQGVHF
jgi:hypothetical protein